MTPPWSLRATLCFSSDKMDWKALAGVGPIGVITSRSTGGHLWLSGSTIATTYTLTPGSPRSWLTAFWARRGGFRFPPEAFPLRNSYQPLRAPTVAEPPDSPQAQIAAFRPAQKRRIAALRRRDLKSHPIVQFCRAIGST